MASSPARRTPGRGAAGQPLVAATVSKGDELGPSDSAPSLSLRFCSTGSSGLFAEAVSQRPKIVLVPRDASRLIDPRRRAGLGLASVSIPVKGIGTALLRR